MNFTFEITNESLNSPFKDSFFINDSLSAVSLINHVININGVINNLTNKAYFCYFVQYIISDIDKKIETLLNKIMFNTYTIFSTYFYSISLETNKNVSSGCSQLLLKCCNR